MVRCDTHDSLEQEKESGQTLTTTLTMLHSTEISRESKSSKAAHRHVPLTTNSYHGFVSSDPYNLNWLTAMRCRSQKLLSHRAWQASEAQAPVILATTFPSLHTLFVSHLQYEDEQESV